MKHLPVADSWVGIVKNKTFFGSEKDAYYDLWQRGARRYDRWPYAKPSVKVFNYLQMDELNDLDQVNDHTVDVIKQKKIVGKKFSTLSRREVLRLASVLKRCGQNNALADGKLVHDHIWRCGYDRNTFLGNWVVQMYGDCGSMAHARAVFDTLPNQNLYSWTILIKGYVKNGCGREALDCFERMQMKAIKPDCKTLTCALDACAILGALDKGHKIHAAIIGSGYEEKLVVATALVNMYGKCANLKAAWSIFSKIPQKDLICWNAMPKMAHYLCLLDILGRAGHLEDAESLINDMPYKNKASLWLCLLGACRTHGDVERGIRAANHVFKLDPNNPAPYVLLSNIFVEAGRLDDAKKLSSF